MNFKSSGTLLRYFTIVVFLLLSGLSFAAIGPMNYQGRLLDINGIPITNPSVTFVVGIYDASTGGTLMFEETHSSVDVDDGVYNFLVSTGTPSSGYEAAWDINLWNNPDLYLQVTADGEDLLPRTKLAAAPFAFHANVAEIAKQADALGVKTASEYDNILEGICVSGKGKWLPDIELCAGGAADLTGLTPASISFDTDFTNLEFAGADFTDAVFYELGTFTGNFRDTNFDRVSFSNTNFDNANLTGAVFDGIALQSGGSFSLSLDGANLTNVVMKNFDASLLDISTATVTGLAAAELTACPAPAGLPPSWFCVAYGESNDKYALIGPGADLSVRTPALIKYYGADYLAVSQFGGDLTDITFEGAFLGGNFDGAFLINGNFRNARLIDATFENISELTNSDFSNAILRWVTFDETLFEYDIVPVNFQKAELSNTVFTRSQVLDVDFTRAKLDNVTFIDNDSSNGGDISSINFDRARLRNVEFSYNDFSFKIDFKNDAILDEVAFINNSGGHVYFVGDNSGLQPRYVTILDSLFDNNSSRYTFDTVKLKRVRFDGEDLTTSSFNNVEFADSTLQNVNLTGVNWGSANLIFKNTTFYNVNFTSANLSGSDWSVTGDNYSYLYGDFTNANFSGAIFTGLDWINAYPANGADFSTTDFSGSNSVYIDGVDTVASANFSGANYISLNLSGTGNADNADFSGISSLDLNGVVTAINSDFTGVEYVYGNFSSADFTGADFTNANLNGVSGMGTATVTSAIWNNTTCPDGSNSDGNGSTCVGHF